MQKADFPIFENRPDLVYLDSAATSLTPKSVIDAITEYFTKYSTNTARGLYPLAEETTERFEAVRKKTADFLNAKPEEIIFTSGTTDSLNMTARLLEEKIDEKSEILVTKMEHHSNFLPWKELALRKNAKLSSVSLTEEGEVSIEALLSKIHPETKILALSVISNVLGTINDIPALARAAKEKNSELIIVVDAAQAAGHIAIDTRAWDIDFLAFSSHKMFGPTGLGILYGRETLLETLSPSGFGGGMVQDACAKKPTYREIPYRFEAGTPDIAAVFAFGAALDSIKEMGLENIRAHEKELSSYAKEKLEEVFGDRIRVLGPNNEEKRGGVLAFVLKDIHPHDIAQILGEKNIAIRAGEHCAAPLHRALGLPATARLSFSVYNEKSDIDTLINALASAEKILK